MKDESVGHDLKAHLYREDGGEEVVKVVQYLEWIVETRETSDGSVTKLSRRQADLTGSFNISCLPSEQVFHLQLLPELLTFALASRKGHVCTVLYNSWYTPYFFPTGN